MDSLLCSVKLARESFALPTQVRIHSVIRKSGRGVPSCVIQAELTGKRAEDAHGTVKAAVLRGDSIAENLVITSCYDQKPFYMISTRSAPCITWIEHCKRVWSQTLKKNIDDKFLRFSLLHHEYNFEMNDNDVANQLRLFY